DAQALAGDVAITKDGANLLRLRLHNGISLQPEMGHCEIKLAIGLELQQGAEGGDLVELGIIFDDLLGVEPSTRREFQIADNGRPVAWSGGESKGGNRVEGFENIALARNQRAAEGVVEEMFLYQIPGKKIDGLVLAGFDKKALGYAVLDFV